MRRFLSLGLRSALFRSFSVKRPQSGDVGRQPETGDGVSLESRYLIQDKDLQKIHKAAYRGNVSEVQRLLSLHPERLNDTDSKKRTALHLASAFGHPEVVNLLAEKKCQMNFGDNKNRTALMVAVKCQEEECVTILLKHGADPHLKDFRSNTALHYAAMGHNTAIAEQLLQHQADMEATNEFELTPFLVAVRKNNLKMVEFLLKRHANINAVDKWKSLTCKPGNNDSSSVSTHGAFDVDTKKEATEPAIEKRENGMDIESAPQGQTSNVKRSSLGLGQDEDEESPRDSETNIEVEDPVPNTAVGMDDVQPFRPELTVPAVMGITEN